MEFLRTQPADKPFCLTLAFFATMPRTQTRFNICHSRKAWLCIKNLRADPPEENDFIADPAQAERLAEMRRRFVELKSAAR